MNAVKNVIIPKLNGKDTKTALEELAKEDLYVLCNIYGTIERFYKRSKLDISKLDYKDCWRMRSVSKIINSIIRHDEERRLALYYRLEQDSNNGLVIKFVEMETDNNENIISLELPKYQE